MDSPDFDCDESEIIADDLSDFQFSCSDNELSDNDNYLSEDSDSFPVRKHPRTYCPTNFDSESDENGFDVEDDSDWTEIDDVPDMETFLGEAGIKVLPPNPTNILDVVKLFLGDDLFSFLAEESNKYRNQNADKFRDSKKSVKWKDISVLEMKKFIGLILMMGKVQKDTRDEYWTTDPGCATPIFPQVMSRDRFRQIWGCWHFCDNLMQIGASNDRLAKIRPVLDYLLPKFLSVYKPQQQLSLYESIIPWRGRLSFRVHNGSKIIKYGVLVRMVCESMSGYICNLKIYTTENNTVLDKVQLVLEPYYNLWHHVYMDSFYNSVSNTELLLQHGIRTCGTIHRGLPTCLKTVNLQTGQSTYCRKNQTLLQIWKTKNKYIRMITNIHSAAFRETNKKDYKTGKMVKKPSCIDDYNKFTRGVDRADQYTSYYYKVMRKTVKWTKRVVMFLINCALFNSYCVYNLLNKTHIKYKKFIYMVGCKWAIESIQEHHKTMPSSPTASPSRKDSNLRLSADLSKHKLEKITTTSKVKYPTRKCRVCTAHKIRGETRYMCSFCKVALHKGDCFERYHSIIKY